MQSVVSLDTTDIYTDKKRPCAKLQEKTRNCVSMFRSLHETVDEVIEIGKPEGFTPKEIGQFIRNDNNKLWCSVSIHNISQYHDNRVTVGIRNANV
ncbi:hypothetical protein [Nitrososphaera sp. AFS]|uniref:hypothetical protein n=1 Tax=Nitrososphaera sp. AFS TaxID=2301191 RepID=UPI001392462F|nr:hypothetical protein [Nitrososphaera sp. AFS]NAL78272.1 hypothetical protein [Nitrososphaera sp. AFS]